MRLQVPVVTVSAVDATGVTMTLGDSEETLRIQAPQMPPSFATVGEQLDLSFRSGGASTEDVLVEVRRMDGTLVWLQVDGFFNEAKIAEMQFPVEWSLAPICSEMGVSAVSEHYDFLNQLLVTSTIDGRRVELHAWEEETITLEGSEYLMSVRFAKEFGEITCVPGDCSDLAHPGRHLNVQVLSAELAAEL